MKLQKRLLNSASSKPDADKDKSLMLRSAERIDELEKSRDFWASQDRSKRSMIRELEHKNERLDFEISIKSDTIDSLRSDN